MESERSKIELSVVSDPWNTIWLIKKALYESEKRKVPVRIEVKSGSVESTIFLIASLADIGALAFAMIVYIHSRRRKDKPLRITGFNREMAYAYTRHQLRTEAEVFRPILVEERPTSDGGYFFKFEDAVGNIHKFTITRDFNVEYSRESKFTLT